MDDLLSFFCNYWLPFQTFKAEEFTYFPCLEGSNTNTCNQFRNKPRFPSWTQVEKPWAFWSPLCVLMTCVILWIQWIWMVEFKVVGFCYLCNFYLCFFGFNNLAVILMISFFTRDKKHHSHFERNLCFFSSCLFWPSPEAAAPRSAQTKKNSRKNTQFRSQLRKLL